MYLALCLSPNSEKAIRTAVPSAGELHLTIIHSLERMPAVKAPVPLLVNASAATLSWYKSAQTLFPFEALTAGLNTFGGKTKVVALRLQSNAVLRELRELAEAVLFDANISWSKQWQFSPHITLGRGISVELASPLPSVVTFDSMEWRE